MKFLLINATEGMRFFAKKKDITSTGSSYIPPIGLLYIASSLEKGDHTVEIIDWYCELKPEKKIRKSLSSVDAVGLSVYTDNYPEINHITRLIREIDSEILIFIGGPHCTFHPKKALIDVPAADISVEGEGERVINNIAEVLNGRKKISEISGVYYRKNNKIKTGQPAEIIKELDSLPFPSRHLVDKYEYGKVYDISFYQPKFTTMMTTRGCPFRCKFCTRHVTTIKTYRERSVDNVIKEFQEISNRYGSVMMVDDNFLFNKKRVHKIMDIIIELGSDLDIYIQGARVDSADIEVYKKMKKAGVKHIYFGIESGNQEILDFYNKQITLEQVRKAINLCVKMNFLTLGTFILGAPIETEKHIENTIDFACSLPLDIAVFTPLGYQSGSDLWFEAVKNGCIKENDGYNLMADKRRGLGNFTSEELKEFCKEGFRRFYSRPSYIFKQIFRGLIRQDFSLIKTGFNYL